MSRMQSPETAKVTVRVDDRLLEEYDEVIEKRGTNRSEDIRSYMRSVADAPDPEAGREPPKDDEKLAQGYKALREAASGRTIPVREAVSVVASATNIQKESVSRRVLKPLEKRGYLARTGDPINDPWLEVR